METTQYLIQVLVQIFSMAVEKKWLQVQLKLFINKASKMKSKSIRNNEPLKCQNTSKTSLLKRIKKKYKMSIIKGNS